MTSVTATAGQPLGSMRRGAFALGALAVGSPLFALGRPRFTDFLTMKPAAIIVVPVLGLLVLVGAVTGLRLLVFLAGLGFALSALLQLTQFGRSPNWLGGDGTTFSLLLGLTVGLLAVSAIPPTAYPPRHPDDDD
nr:hypothetical protein [uncultured Friedmanniella sp.]